MSTNIVSRTTNTPQIMENKNGGKTVLMTIAVNRGKNKDGEQIVDYIQTKAFISKDAISEDKEPKKEYDKLVVFSSSL